jgi:hypothetical protein
LGTNFIGQGHFVHAGDICMPKLLMDKRAWKVPDEMGFREPVREMCIFQRTKPKMFTLRTVL